MMLNEKQERAPPLPVMAGGGCCFVPRMAWGRELGLTAAGGERIAVEGVAPRCWPSEVSLPNTFCGQDVVGGGQSYLNKISRINKKRGDCSAVREFCCLGAGVV